MSDSYPPPHGSGDNPSEPERRPSDPNEGQHGQGDPYGQQPPPYTHQPYGQQPYGQGYGGYPQQLPNHRGAVPALVLGILSLVCCGLFTGIPAMIIGRRAMREIDASPGMYAGRGNAQAGFICGLIGTILSVLGILFYVGVFALMIGTGELDEAPFEEGVTSSARVLVAAGPAGTSL